jgi:hypothetical protein
MKKFEIGKTYFARSACDHNCIWHYTVTARTPKTVTLSGDDGTITRRVKGDSDGEYCLPQGSFSMAPVLRATREVSTQ